MSEVNSKKITNVEHPMWVKMHIDPLPTSFTHLNGVDDANYPFKSAVLHMSPRQP